MIADGETPNEEIRLPILGTVLEAPVERPDYQSFGTRSVMTFLLDTEDPNTHKQVTKLVEMRGLAFQGFAYRNDSVIVHGRWREGILRSNRIENKNTQAIMRRRGQYLKWIGIVTAIVFLLGFLATLAAIIVGFGQFL